MNKRGRSFKGVRNEFTFEENGDRRWRRRRRRQPQAAASTTPCPHRHAAPRQPGQPQPQQQKAPQEQQQPTGTQKQPGKSGRDISAAERQRRVARRAGAARRETSVGTSLKGMEAAWYREARSMERPTVRSIVDSAVGLCSGADVRRARRARCRRHPRGVTAPGRQPRPGTRPRPALELPRAAPRPLRRPARHRRRARRSGPRRRDHGIDESTGTRLLVNKSTTLVTRRPYKRSESAATSRRRRRLTTKRILVTAKRAAARRYHMGRRDNSSRSKSSCRQPARARALYERYAGVQTK